MKLKFRLWHLFAATFCIAVFLTFGLYKSSQFGCHNFVILGQVSDPTILAKIEKVLANDGFIGGDFSHVPRWPSYSNANREIESELIMSNSTDKRRVLVIWVTRERGRTIGGAPSPRGDYIWIHYWAYNTFTNFELWQSLDRLVNSQQSSRLDELAQKCYQIVATQEVSEGNRR
jgi:hypothetical protein